MRPAYDKQLETLHEELISMGEQCQEAISLSVRSLVSGDVEMAHGVEELAGRIDRCERRIEGMCIRLLLKEQPVATDLRTISAALKMITDMERIGNNSGDIAEIVSRRRMEPGELGQMVADMGKSVSKMVSDSVRAFVNEDQELARAVISGDDVVDDYFGKIKDALAERLPRSDESGQTAVDLLMISKYLERIGDHAANIAEWVLYSILGSRPDLPQRN